LDVLTICNPVDSSKKLVSRSRDQLRKEFTELLIESIRTISDLDIRDKHGHVIEFGYSIIETILMIERQRKNIDEQIQIIGMDKWLKLKKIWNRMRKIEEEDKILSSNIK